MTPTNPSLGAFVVAWNWPEVLEGTLRALMSQTSPPDAIFVVDNGDGAAEIARKVGGGRIECRSTGDNLGPAGGVAFGMRWLTDLGYDWIQVIDHDDPPWRDDIVERLRLLIHRHHDDPELGAVGRSGSRWDWRRGHALPVADEELCGDVVIDWAGGNQQLTVRRQVIETMGPYEKDLFFALEDVFFCLRMVQAGWYLLADGDLWAITRHEKARRGQTPPAPLRRRLRRSPAWRGYYSTRNYIAEMRRTFGRPDLARREVGRAAFRSAVSWRHGPRYGMDVTSYQARAVVDGYGGRMGRTVEPIPKPRS